MNHQIRCRCGKLKGNIESADISNHLVCYCKDCQAFARFLGRENLTLDAAGGTEVVQLLPKYIQILEGEDTLACMQLSDKGLVRWYTRCCNTPIGNTLANPKISFIGLVHDCLEHDDKSMVESFGPIRMRANTNSAIGATKPASIGIAAGVFRIMTAVLKARLNGSYKHNPFFNVDRGQPIVQPTVLSTVELERLKHSASSKLSD